MTWSWGVIEPDMAKDLEGCLVHFFSFFLDVARYRMNYMHYFIGKGGLVLARLRTY